MKVIRTNELTKSHRIVDRFLAAWSIDRIVRNTEEIEVIISGFESNRFTDPVTDGNYETAMAGGITTVYLEYGARILVERG